jgi:hypothetical protein
MVWSVLGVAVFQGIMPPMHASLGMLIYVVGTGVLIVESKQREQIFRPANIR